MQRIVRVGALVGALALGSLAPVGPRPAGAAPPHAGAPGAHAGPALRQAGPPPGATPSLSAELSPGSVSFLASLGVPGMPTPGGGARRYRVDTWPGLPACGPGEVALSWSRLEPDGTWSWYVVWWCAPMGGGAGAPTPAQLADLAGSAAISTVTVSSDPAVQGLVGLATSLWYEGPTTARASGLLGGHWCGAAADAGRFTFLGSGDELGTSLVPGTHDEPAVRIVFEERTQLTLSVTARWSGLAACIGPDGSAGPVVVLAAVVVPSPGRDYPVPEAQALLTG